MRQFKLNSTKLEFSFSNEKRLSQDILTKSLSNINSLIVSNYIDQNNLQRNESLREQHYAPNEVILKLNNLSIDNKLKL